MIPLRDTVRAGNYPVVNNILIGVNVLVFLFQLSLGVDGNRFVYIFGLVPARYSNPQISAYFSAPYQLFSFLSFMFLHGGFWHLLGNMWSLYIFGDNVEDRLGHLRYLVFYLNLRIRFRDLPSSFEFELQCPHHRRQRCDCRCDGRLFYSIPAIKILTLIPIFFIPYFLEIPAYFFLGFWFILQFISAAGSHGQVSGVAWWAHIGGFIFGILFLRILLALPSAGPSDAARRLTARRKTPHLQVIRPVGPGLDPHLYGTIYHHSP